MILSNNNGTFTPTAGGTGTFIGTAAAFNAVKATLPVNTVAYITDDGNGDLQPVDAVTNGDMHPVTSNAVYDALPTFEQYIFQLTYTIPADSWLDIATSINWSQDIVVISRWLGSVGLSLVNYYEGSNNKVILTVQNTTPASITVTSGMIHVTVIRSKVNWQ